VAQPECWLTESQWLADAPVFDLTDFIAEVGSGRKLRLFTHACCRRVEHLLVDPRSRSALVAVSRYAEGECGRDELVAHWRGARAAKRAIEVPLVRDGRLHTTAESLAASAVAYAVSPYYAGAIIKPFYHSSTVTDAANAALVATGSVAYARAEERSECEAAQAAEAAVQTLLLRDIFGNPFRPVAFSPSWRTDTAVALARQMYESRDFGAMPILADALQEAGCEDAAILSHCRGTGPHVRGCWVVDLVLGKE
jgi:hypothetical protein